MQKKNIVVKKTYKDKTGNERVLWNTIGNILVFDDGKMTMELHFLPDTKFHIFDQKLPTAQDVGNSIDSISF